MRWITALGLLAAWAAGSAPAFAQEAPPPSRCLAIAQAAPGVVPVVFAPPRGGLTTFLQAQSGAREVGIRYVGHSTFLIESPQGVTIATDYAGRAGGVVPDAVTMNRAHPSHNTPNPDPAIRHVLRGWNPEGGPARHNLGVGDVLIRNVTTDLRGFGFDDDGVGVGRIADGNSIFIFEMAGLCIGHLGHLHQLLEPEDLGWIGQLDVVMVPVDGTYTLAQSDMIAVLEVLKARLILPMHYFTAANLQRFLDGLAAEDFDVVLSDTPEITVSVATLPDRPTVMVLPGN